uniref:Uncharacterized protein n=1 Tax=Arundo donax TaxID=35708 RepID=A0A0A9DHV0_ARUDO
MMLLSCQCMNINGISKKVMSRFCHSRGLVQLPNQEDLTGELLVPMKMLRQNVDGLLVLLGAICLLIHVILLEQLSISILEIHLITAVKLMF